MSDDRDTKRAALEWEARSFAESLRNIVASNAAADGAYGELGREILSTVVELVRPMSPLLSGAALVMQGASLGLDWCAGRARAATSAIASARLALAVEHDAAGEPTTAEVEEMVADAIRSHGPDAPKEQADA